MHSNRTDRPDGLPVVETEVGRDQSASDAVPEAVAAATNVSPTDLPALYDAIDPDALDGVVRSLRADGWVVFPYGGCTIAAYGDGTVEVYDGS